MSEVGGVGYVPSVEGMYEQLSNPIPPTDEEFSSLKNTLINGLNVKNFVPMGDEKYSTTLRTIYGLENRLDPIRFQEDHQAYLDSDEVKIGYLLERDKNYAQEDTEKGRLYGQLKQLAKNLIDVNQLCYPDSKENIDKFTETYNLFIDIAKNLPGNGNVQIPRDPTISFYAPMMKDITDQLIKDREDIKEPIQAINYFNNKSEYDSYHSPYLGIYLDGQPLPLIDRLEAGRNLQKTTQNMSDNIINLQKLMSFMPGSQNSQDYDALNDLLNSFKTEVSNLKAYADREVNGINEFDNSIWNGLQTKVEDSVFDKVLKYDFSNAKYPDSLRR